MRDEFGGGAVVDLDGVVGRERQPVRVPVREGIRQDAEAQGHEHPRAAAQGIAHPTEQGREGGHEQGGLDGIHRTLHLRQERAGLGTDRPPDRPHVGTISRPPKPRQAAAGAPTGHPATIHCQKAAIHEAAMTTNDMPETPQGAAPEGKAGPRRNKRPRRRNIFHPRPGGPSRRRRSGGG